MASEANASELPAPLLAVENICAVVQQVAMMVAPQMSQSRVSLEVSLPSEPLWVMVDSTKLRQVVINLLSNSIRLTERGYVRLRCEVVGSEGDTTSVLIEVSDSGPGLPAERLARLTQRWGLSVGGSGLGLYLVQQLLQCMGSELHATSPIEHTRGAGVGGVELGPGAAIRFTLRLSLATAPVLSGGSTAAALPSKMRVLIADDMRMNRLLLKCTLKAVCETWEIVEASTAEQALELFFGALDGKAEKPFGLILMDEHFDDGFGSECLTGTEAAQQIREAGRRQVLARDGAGRVAIINCSAADDVAIDAAYDGVWGKPPPTATEMKQCLPKLLRNSGSSS